MIFGDQIHVIRGGIHVLILWLKSIDAILVFPFVLGLAILVFLEKNTCYCANHALSVGQTLTLVRLKALTDD